MKLLVLFLTVTAVRAASRVTAVHAASPAGTGTTTTTAAAAGTGTCNFSGATLRDLVTYAQPLWVHQPGKGCTQYIKGSSTFRNTAISFDSLSKCTEKCRKTTTTTTTTTTAAADTGVCHFAAPTLKDLVTYAQPLWMHEPGKGCTEYTKGSSTFLDTTVSFSSLSACTAQCTVDCSQQVCITDVCWDGQARHEIDGKCCQCPSDPDCSTDQTGWSVAKSLWCCHKRKLGCKNGEDAVRASPSAYCAQNPGVCTKQFCEVNPLKCRSAKLTNSTGHEVKRHERGLCCNPENDSHGSDTTTCSFGKSTDEKTGTKHTVLQVKHSLTGRHNSHNHRCSQVAHSVTGSATCRCCECKPDGQALKHACALKYVNDLQECSSLTAAQCEKRSKIVYAKGDTFNVKRCILMTYAKGDPKCKMSNVPVTCHPASLKHKKVCEADANGNERAYATGATTTENKCARCGHLTGVVACAGARCDAVDENTGEKLTFHTKTGKCTKCGKEGWLACGGDTCDATSDAGHKLHPVMMNGYARCAKCGHLNGRACGGTLCDNGLVVNDNAKCKEV
eukprot:g5012.t1